MVERAERVSAKTGVGLTESDWPGSLPVQPKTVSRGTTSLHVFPFVTSVLGVSLAPDRATPPNHLLRNPIQRDRPQSSGQRGSIQSLFHTAIGDENNIVGFERHVWSFGT